MGYKWARYGSQMGQVWVPKWVTYGSQMGHMWIIIGHIQVVSESNMGNAAEDEERTDGYNMVFCKNQLMNQTIRCVSSFDWLQNSLHLQIHPHTNILQYNCSEDTTERTCRWRWAFVKKCKDSLKVLTLWLDQRMKAQTSFTGQALNALGILLY